MSNLVEKSITPRTHFAPPTPRKTRRPEWRLQAEVISEFHRLEANGWQFTCAGDMNAEKRSIHARTKAKVTGMTAGEPDVRCYCEGGYLGLIELKAEGGKLSADQIIRHERLQSLGFDVRVMWAKTPEEAKTKAVKILREFIECAKKRLKN